MKLCDLDIEIDRICNEVCGHGRELCVWKPEGCNQIDSLEKATPIEAIPVDWLKQQFYDNPNSQWAEKCRDVFTGWQKWQRLQKEQEMQNG